MNLRDRALGPWSAFLLLGCIWGASHMFIKLGLRGFPPLTLVAVRLLLSLVFLLPFVIARRDRFPRDRQSWLNLLFAGAIGVALPFSLIHWGQERIDSALAAILLSATPFFSVLLADVWLRDRPVTPGKLAGLMVGFLGIVTLMGAGLADGGRPGAFAGQLAIVLASLCYGCSYTFVRRRLVQLDPVMFDFGQLLIADLLVWLVALSFEGRPDFVAGLSNWQVVVSVLWLGVLGSGVAYLLYFFLIRSWGSTRASLVTYVTPLVGMALGILVLREPLTWRLPLGAGLVALGILLVNLRELKLGFSRRAGHAGRV